MFIKPEEISDKELREISIYIDKAVDNLREALLMNITDEDFNQKIYAILNELGPYEKEVFELEQARNPVEF
jgi:hypothetical protein